VVAVLVEELDRVLVAVVAQVVVTLSA